MTAVCLSTYNLNPLFCTDNIFFAAASFFFVKDIFRYLQHPSTISRSSALVPPQGSVSYDFTDQIITVSQRCFLQALEMRKHHENKYPVKIFSQPLGNESSLNIQYLRGNMNEVNE